MNIRPATAGDVVAIQRAMAPHLSTGALLPRRVTPHRFTIAEDHQGHLLGAVALEPWSVGVVELGSLVATRPGRGVGRALTRAATDLAARRGFQQIVALTHLVGFFGRSGFATSPTAPWAFARRAGAQAEDEAPTALVDAIAHKSLACAGCARLQGCQQTLMVRQLSAFPAQRVCA